jgi:pimeloyl-ACP methyl ester carboxylesterase
MSLGANVSLFAAERQPERVRGLILEMPVLERAVPSAAAVFVPLLVLVHYGRSLLRLTSAVLRRAPLTHFGPLDSFVHAASLPPDSMAAVLHGILVGPIAPTQEERARIHAPTLLLAHRNDLVHPFDDAVALTQQLPNATLVRAHSPLELRLWPRRLTDEMARFLDDAWQPTEVAKPTAGGAVRRPTPARRKAV